MPHQEPAPTLTPTEMIRHLWRFRIYFLILPPVFFLAAYFYVRVFLGETFEANAMLYIRTPASSLGENQPQIHAIDPPVYVDFLKGDEIIATVIEAGKKKFPDLYRGDFEKLKKNFELESIMTRDTSVQATYSPVLSLSVKAGNRQVVKFLADEWVHQIVDKYGQLRMRQAQQFRAIGEEQYEKYSKQSLELQQQEVQLDQTLEALNLKLDANARILLGAGGPGGEPGLYERRMQAKLALGEAKLTEANASAKAKVEIVENLVAETEKENTDLGTRKAKVMGELEKVRKDLISARLQLESARSLFVDAMVDATPLPDPLNPENSGDLLVLSRPVQPEVRIAPPRSILAATITVFLTGLVAVMFLLNLYLKRSVLEARS